MKWNGMVVVFTRTGKRFHEIRQTLIKGCPNIGFGGIEHLLPFVNRSDIWIYLDWISANIVNVGLFLKFHWMTLDHMTENIIFVAEIREV